MDFNLIEHFFVRCSNFLAVLCNVNYESFEHIQIVSSKSPTITLLTET